MRSAQGLHSTNCPEHRLCWSGLGCSRGASLSSWQVTHCSSLEPARELALAHVSSGSCCVGEMSRGQCGLGWGVQTSDVSKTGSWWAPYVSTAVSSANSRRPDCEPDTGFQHGQTPEPSKRMPSSGQNTEPSHERQVLIRAIVEGQQVQ